VDDEPPLVTRMSLVCAADLSFLSSPACGKRHAHVPFPSRAQKKKKERKIAGIECVAARDTAAVPERRSSLSCPEANEQLDWLGIVDQAGPCTLLAFPSPLPTPPAAPFSLTRPLCPSHSLRLLILGWNPLVLRCRGALWWGFRRRRLLLFLFLALDGDDWMGVQLVTAYRVRNSVLSTGGE